MLPSYAEEQPIAVLEAMALGLPVVVTSIGANPGGGRDGVEGLLVEPGDPTTLADALERVVRDPALRMPLGQAAHERARRRSCRRVLRERLLQEYAAAAARARRRTVDPEGRAGAVPAGS